jgi:hypothetical protein
MRVKTAHVYQAMCNLAHWLTRQGSPTIYRCFALPQLPYRWRHQSRKFWIPPCKIMLHGPSNRYNSRWTLFFVRSLRTFINVDGVGFVTSFHRPHTGGPEIAVTIRGVNETDSCCSGYRVWQMSGAVAENWENAATVSDWVNKINMC